MLAIGLMSGTSLDGVDAALVEIKEGKSFELLKYILLPYEKEFKEKIMRNLSDETARLSEICSLNFELGYKFKEAIDKLLESTNYKYSDIDFVASHGQTIWHNPKQNGNLVPSTLQIGEPSVISTLTNIKVVSNFRTADIVAGGEGAPLVPMSEYLLFKSDNKSVVLQNIGGIGNLTYLKNGCSLDEVVAFDTGPGNVIIDYFVNKYFNLPFDEGGKIALSGDIILSIFNELIKDEYISKVPPKSTGREKYSVSNLEELSKRFDFDSYAKEDIITTITEYTVYTIVYNYKKFIKDIDTIIVGGGGSHNTYIMNRLKEEFGDIVYTQDELGYSSDAKEAIAFVVLGYLSLCGMSGNVKNATGAKFSAVLGNITAVRGEN